MEIDFGDCYEAMDHREPDSVNCIGPFVRRRIDEYVKAYHKQLEEGLYHNYVHRAIQGTEPACDCAGREKLQDLGTLYYKAGGYHNCWYLSRKVSEEHGGYTQVTCPLCDRRLP